MEEEIDLRQYIEVLLKYKFWIIGLALLAAIVAFVISSLQPVTYQAEASLAMLRVRSAVAFEPNYQTLSEDELQLQTDLRSRRETLATLAKSPSVAAAVLQQLGERLKGVADGITPLLDMVKVGNDGDLILVKVKNRNPQLAADIANAWAELAEASINTIYGQLSLPAQELQTQFQEAQDRYETNQNDLESFLAQNQIPELERKIQHRRELIASFQQTLTDSESTLFNKPLENNRQILSHYYAELVSIEQVLVDARSLEGELERAGSASATEWAHALALIGIQNRAFGTGGQQLQILVSGEAPVTQVQDLKQLIAVLEQKADSMRTAISQMEQELFDVEVNDTLLVSTNALEQRIQSLTQELIELQAQLEAEQARERELAQARDLAWETHQTMARKLAEIEVTTQALSSDVRIAAPALKPEQAMPRGRLMNTAIAGTLGLMVGVFGAFIIEWWRQEPSDDASPSVEDSAE